MNTHKQEIIKWASYIISEVNEDDYNDVARMAKWLQKEINALLAERAASEEADQQDKKEMVKLCTAK